MCNNACLGDFFFFSGGGGGSLCPGIGQGFSVFHMQPVHLLVSHQSAETLSLELTLLFTQSSWPLNSSDGVVSVFLFHD